MILLGHMLWRGCDKHSSLDYWISSFNLISSLLPNEQNHLHTKLLPGYDSVCPGLPWIKERRKDHFLWQDSTHRRGSSGIYMEVSAWWEGFRIWPPPKKGSDSHCVCWSDSILASWAETSLINVKSSKAKLIRLPPPQVAEHGKKSVSLHRWMIGW